MAIAQLAHNKTATFVLSGSELADIIATKYGVALPLGGETGDKVTAQVRREHDQAVLNDLMAGLELYVELVDVTTTDL